MIVFVLGILLVILLVYLVIKYRSLEDKPVENPWKKVEEEYGLEEAQKELTTGLYVAGRQEQVLELEDKLVDKLNEIKEKRERVERKYGSESNDT